MTYALSQVLLAALINAVKDMRLSGGSRYCDFQPTGPLMVDKVV